MNRTRRLRLVLCTLLCFVLCSCQTVLPANEKAQVEELLRAPKLSGDYGALQTALNDWLGESAQLKYPIQGELLSPFVLQDLDGDGQQDAAVLYTTAQTANVCVAILQRDDTGSWQVRQSVEGLAAGGDEWLVRVAHGGERQPCPIAGYGQLPAGGGLYRCPE